MLLYTTIPVTQPIILTEEKKKLFVKNPIAKLLGFDECKFIKHSRNDVCERA